MQGCALIGLINILCVLWMSHFCNANKRETFHKKNRSREGSASGPKNITKNRLSLALGHLFGKFSGLFHISTECNYNDKSGKTN